MYAVKTHEYCVIPPRSETIAGSAVATIVWSSAASSSVTISPRVDREDPADRELVARGLPAEALADRHSTGTAAIAGLPDAARARSRRAIASPPDDLPAVEVLREEEQREHDREEGLEVREERRARRPDAVDRGEPEDVREEERADDGEGEGEPGRRAEIEVLLEHLRQADDRERDPAEREHERADPERRVPAHQRRDGDGVAPQVAAVPTASRTPRRFVEKPPPAPAATRPTPTNDTPAAAQNARAGRSMPTTVARTPMKIGRRPEHERDRRRRRQLHRVHERDLVDEDHQRREPDRAASRAS